MKAAELIAVIRADRVIVWIECIRLPAYIAPLIYRKVGIGTPAVIEL